MNGFLDQLEHELVSAADRHARARRLAASGADAGARRRALAPPRGRFAWRMRLSVRVLALAGLVVLVAAAAALAATGILFTGAPVPATLHLSKGAGVGLPQPGHSRLIARGVPDPAGGADWSMRILHTTRGQICLQIGRLHDGRIGVLGEDGAFHDDGLFHPFPTTALETMPRRHAIACAPQVQTFSEQIIGMPASAQLPSEGALGRPAQERMLLYGLLGPSAVSVTYRARDGREMTVAVERRTGAYLIVLPATQRSTAVKTGLTAGLPSRNEGRLRAEPPLVAIRYRLHGRICVEGGLHPAAADACPRESPAPIERRLHSAPPDLHVPIRVELRPMPAGWWKGIPTKGGHPARPPGEVDGVYYTAWISFEAPFSVGDASSGYELGVGPPGAGGSVTEMVQRDIQKGQTVRLRRDDLFANSHGRPVTVEVIYYNLLAKHRIDRVVGRTIVKP